MIAITSIITLGLTVMFLDTWSLMLITESKINDLIVNNYDPFFSYGAQIEGIKDNNDTISDTCNNMFDCDQKMCTLLSIDINQILVKPSIRVKCGLDLESYMHRFYERGFENQVNQYNDTINILWISESMLPVNIILVLIICVSYILLFSYKNQNESDLTQLLAEHGVPHKYDSSHYKLYKCISLVLLFIIVIVTASLSLVTLNKFYDFFTLFSTDTYPYYLLVHTLQWQRNTEILKFIVEIVFCSLLTYTLW